jgi:hypothetical protein
VALFVDGQATPAKALPIDGKTYITAYNDLYYATGK